MTILVSCQSISKSHGFRLLFKDLSCGIFEKDRIGLIGPNGSGKSTLLKMIAGLELPDTGAVTKKRDLRVSYVPQESNYPDLSVEEIVISSFNKNSHIDAKVQAKIVLGKLGFKDLDARASLLSGGWKKRLDLAIALAKEPDLLLLDEPTNHLDLEGIIWLENFLLKEDLTYVVISHDRLFLEKISSKVAEINRVYPDGIFMSSGNYSTFLEKRENFLEGQKRIEHSLSSKVRREVEWLKQNPKARTTKAQSRIQEAERLIEKLGDVKTRNRETELNPLDFSSTDRGTKKLLTVKNLTKKMGERTLFSNIDILLTPRTRLGIVGGNGTGKSTFLKILANELSPDKGQVKYAEDLRIVYFDQHRQKINSNQTLKQALAETKETVNYRGQNIHVSSWAKRFLFSSDLLEMPVSQLSGGERARILIAKLMLQPADVLLLDEPTNDLDIYTLEILEESLTSFPGAIVIVTHDRFLLDRIATSILAIDLPTKEGMDENVFADYRQWHAKISQKEKKEPLPPKVTPSELVQKPTSKKLTFKEKLELAQIEETILTIEGEIETINKKILNASPNEISAFCTQLADKQKTLEITYKRWQQLEDKSTI